MNNFSRFTKVEEALLFLLDIKYESFQKFQSAELHRQDSLKSTIVNFEETLKHKLLEQEIDAQSAKDKQSEISLWQSELQADISSYQKLLARYRALEQALIEELWVSLDTQQNRIRQNGIGNSVIRLSDSVHVRDPFSALIFKSSLVEWLESIKEPELAAKMRAACNDLTGDKVRVIHSSKVLPESDIKPRPQIANTADKSSSVTDFPYLTPYLPILVKAMESLFPANRKVDPKKMSAVEKIIEIGLINDVQISSNIAEAIFTIIKPEDHNPKKRRT